MHFWLIPIIKRYFLICYVALTLTYIIIKKELDNQFNAESIIKFTRNLIPFPIDDNSYFFLAIHLLFLSWKINIILLLIRKYYPSIKLINYSIFNILETISLIQNYKLKKPDNYNTILKVLYVLIPEKIECAFTKNHYSS